MVDRRGLVLGAVLCCVLTTGACAGVPATGAVHKVGPAANAGLGAGNFFQQAQGPQPGASQAEIVDQMLNAMSEGDTNAVKQFFTPNYYATWSSTEQDQTLVFSDKIGPLPAAGQQGGNKVSVSFRTTGIIDQDLSYSRTSGTAPVTFTLAQRPDGWRISHINQKGSFVQAASLPQIETPVQLYFPSKSAPPGTVPRLVPDTIFLSSNAGVAPDASPSSALENKVQSVVSELVGGPTGWLAPGVTVTVPETTSVLKVHIDPRTNITTVNLSTPADLSGIATLKAQLAYTLLPEGLLGQTESIQLQLGGTNMGTPFGLQQVDPGYDPDVLGDQSPLYYIGPGDKLVSVGPASQAPNGLPGPTGENSSGESAPTTVVEHLAGVKQIAVEAAAAPDGVVRVAGVRTDGKGVASLVLSAVGDAAPDPWVDVQVPGARHLTTPSFAVTGDAVWTVATDDSGKTTLYRVPLSVGAPEAPVPVPISHAPGSAPVSLTAFRLSRDGARAALVAGGQAYTAVVADTAAGWAVESPRPVISATTIATGVYWGDQSTLGVAIKQGASTTLATVSADGYTLSSDGQSTDHNVVAGNSGKATQFAGGPGQLWAASDGSQVTRQPSPDTTSDATSSDDTSWDSVGPGSWPTYAG